MKIYVSHTCWEREQEGQNNEVICLVLYVDSYGSATESEITWMSLINQYQEWNGKMEWREMKPCRVSIENQKRGVASVSTKSPLYSRQRFSFITYTYVHSYRTFNHYAFIQFIFKRKHFLYFSPSYTTTHSLKRAIFYLIICLHNYCTSTALINPVKRIFMS